MKGRIKILLPFKAKELLSQKCTEEYKDIRKVALLHERCLSSLFAVGGSLIGAAKLQHPKTSVRQF